VAKFEFEKENFHLKREDANNHNAATLLQDTKKAIITEMIRKGATAQEIKDFVDLLL
jgi:hypothetical protein